MEAKVAIVAAEGAGPARWLWPALTVGSAAAIGVATLVGLQGPIRVGLALFFLLVCPGLSLVGLLRLGDAVFELTLGVALSLALDMLIAGGLLYAGAWSPPATLAILIAITIAGAILQVAMLQWGTWPVRRGER